LTGITVWQGAGHTFLSVIRSLLPLLLLFVIFQFAVLKLPRAYVLNLLKGVLLAIAGLALFLQGVSIGFFPAGQYMGRGPGRRLGAVATDPVRPDDGLSGHLGRTGCTNTGRPD
jgi:O-antigen ligase